MKSVPHKPRFPFSPFKHSAAIFTFVLGLFLVVPAWSQTAVAVGDTFPDFSALDQDDNSFRLSDHQGKVVLLHVCAVWCFPCRASAENEAALTDAINAEIGADNWLLVDALYEDNYAQPSTTYWANLWRVVFATPALTLHANGSYTSEMHTIVLPAIDWNGIALPSYIVILPDGTISYTQQGWFSTNGNTPLFEEVVAAWYTFETPSDKLASLILDLEESEEGVAGALAAKLKAAFMLLEDENPDNDSAVGNILRAVTNQINAQRGKKLTEEQAAELIEAVEAIADAL